MFDQFKNIASMMGQAKDLQAKMQQMQEQLGSTLVEAESGAGAVRVTANGKLEIVGIVFDKGMLSTLAGQGEQADQQMIQDLTTCAVNAALEKAKEVVAKQTAQMTGGLNIPGLGKMLQDGTDE